VLPRFAYVLLGGWIGWMFLTPLLGSRVGLPGSSVGIRVDVAATVVGAIIGWLAMRPVNRVLSAFFWLFNAGFTYSTGIYTRLVGGFLRVSALVLVVYAGLLFMTYKGFMGTPAGFIPTQDMGYLLCNVQLPDSASLERTVAEMSKMEKIAKATDGVKFTQINAGQSMLLSANGSNFGSMFVILDEFANRPVRLTDRFFPWLDEAALRLDYLFADKVYKPLGWTWPNDRLKTWVKTSKIEPRVRKWLHAPKKPSLYGEAIADELRKRFAAGIPAEELQKKGIIGADAERLRTGVDAMVTVLGPPPVRGVGRAGGFKIMVEDRGDNGPLYLQGQTENLNDAAKQQPDLTAMTSVFRANVPQLYADVNRSECLAKEVALKDLNDTMRIYLGSLYVNDINLFGRTWQVNVQADAKYRNSVDSVKRLKVRNAEGLMVPLGTVAEIEERNGPLLLTRYNMYPAAPLNGSAAVGVSSGQAIATVQALAEQELPRSMAYEWTELAYLELQAGNTAMIVFGFAVVMVFLVLAAQYESWSLPLAVILVVPMCLLSAVTGVITTFADINIFTQIGFVVLVGLASKNAILIVEFAKARREAGEPRRLAALDACQLRLRPIVMTSMAFILGVVPLILSNGAGAEMRRTLGITVFSGMLGVTVFGIFLTPVFFFVIDWLGSTRVFHLPLVERVSDVALATLTFGYLHPLIRLVQPQQVPRPCPRPHTSAPEAADVPVPSTAIGNGNGNGQGSDTEPKVFVEHKSS
jgi:multidrug efflux pump